MEGFPRRFGGYVLVKPLARGGMGALYLALHGQRGMEKLCVVKTALPHLIEKGYLQRFKDEAKVVVRLSHGNLVGVFDAGQVKGEIYLGMEYVEGKDLRAVWNRCAQKGMAFPLPVAVHIVKELVRGLGYAHSFEGLKLVHRDVSPPNVLLSYSGEVKLTDFGLATSTLKLEKTAPGVVYGKVSYMAPEQARGEPLDGRTDLYAAAIILWELLTGRQLFAPAPTRVPGEEPQDDLLERVRHPQVVSPSQKASRVPRELDTILLKALSSSPDDRFQSGEELRSELAGFLAKHAPAMDGHQVARFLRDLFSDVIVKERAEREELIREGVALLDGTSGTHTPNIAPPAVDGVPEGKADHVDTAPLGQRDIPSTPQPKPLEEGSRMVGALLSGRYQIKRMCGEGGMGRVYEAEHIEIGKRVAIKVLHPAYSRTPDLVERFRREARAASRIEHPNVVNVTDFGTTEDGSLFFVMEYIEGIELGLLIHREGPLPPVRALRIAEQMCEALQAAHDVGVIHRDLKPENILLLGLGGANRTPPTGQSNPGMDPREPVDFVKVLDFGIAKSAEVEESSRRGKRLTRPGVAMGTPEYMAPEQAAGHPADPRSDIYAVGSILYEMLCGAPPYEGDNVMEVLHKKANEPPKSLAELRPALPPAVIALVERAMARAPEDRPKSMADLAYEIHTIETAMVMTPSPMLLTTPGASSRDDAQGAYHAVFGDVSETRVVRPFAKRQRLAIAAVLGSALLFSIGLLWLLHSMRNHPSVPVEPATVSAPTPSVPLPSALLEPGADGGGSPEAMPRAAELDSGTEPSKEPEPAADNGEVNKREGVSHSGRSPTPSSKATEGPKQTEDDLRVAQQLLHAQRYDEAEAAFGRMMASKQLRGSAAAGLARIAFQAKRYKEAVDRAKESARFGGGAEARVLLGDAYFKLEKLEDARKAYTEALKLDPNNRVAGQGLRLVESQQ
jgi:eukaryotic-like serine/threonine-protein kinase